MNKKIDPSHILSVVHTITIDTMLNFNDDNNGHRLKNVTCKQTLKRQEHFLLVMTKRIQYSLFLN